MGLIRKRNVVVLCISIFVKVFDILPREPVANSTYYVD